MGNIKAYVCKNIHSTITIDNEDSGITPFLIQCPECDLQASVKPNYVHENRKITHEWYKPTTFENLTQLEIDHIKNGGLLLRKLN